MPGRRLVVAGFVTLLVAAGCTNAEEPVDTAGAETPAPATATTPSPSPTPTPRPEGETLTVTSADDSGPGTLRQLLTDAQPGDTIVFDPAVFPPDDPQTITVETALPQIVTDYLTIDGSDAGVILDGSLLEEHSWAPGLEILSNHNIVRGLQVVDFPGAGIAVAGGRGNAIGGDRSVGRGPVGQGNLTAGNDFGIGIWGPDPAPAGNIVTGNLVGTDIDGAPGLGNRSSGIWVTEGATDNVIGPDNVVASSGWCGVDVEYTTSVRNTITRNSIRSSSYRGGICHRAGGNERLVAPLVTDIEPSTGRIAGTACVGCVVEVFSDDGGEGATYEGSATADGSGMFTFDKGAAFSSANVTLTATDADGNTSEFSHPFGAASDVLTLQAGSRQPTFGLATKPSSKLAENRIGLAENDWRGLSVEVITDFGAKFVTTSLNENEPPIDWDMPEDSFPGAFSDTVDELAEHGVVIDYMLHYWDKEGHARGEPLATPRFRSDGQIDDFVEHVRRTIRRFKGRVPYYSLWSEPDNCDGLEVMQELRDGQGGIKCVQPDDYIRMAKRVIPVIREEDPQAKVAIAPVVLVHQRDWLPAVLSSDVASMFDVIQWHGAYGPAPDDRSHHVTTPAGVPVNGNYYYEYPGIVEEIKETAEANGFRGEFWSTEMAWCAADMPCEEPDHPWDYVSTDRVAAKYLARAVVMHLGMDIAAGISREQGPWYDPTERRLATVMAGATPTDLAVDISGAVTDVRIQSYGFELPDGNMLFAVWNDGVAVDQDPGIDATLTFPGFSGDEVDVTGLDVLYGFEQSLLTDSQNGDLVVRDLLVKDYPTILQIQP